MSVLGEQGHLVLIGPRASGKTTLGRELAKSLGRAFVDCDEELGRLVGCDASVWLGRVGEPAFRRQEARVLEALADRSGLVVATGGGAVLHAEALAALGRGGCIVHLDLPLEEQLRRQERAPRPRLRRGGLAEEIAALHAERDALYRDAADISLIPEGAHSILAALEIRPPGPHAS